MTTNRVVDGDVVPMTDEEAADLLSYQREYAQRLEREGAAFVARVSSAQAELAALGLSPEAIATISKYPYPFSLDGVESEQPIA